MNREVGKYFKYSYNCSHCGVTGTSMVSLREHTLALRHKEMVQYCYLVRVSHPNSLQHFLDTYVKDYPILGLEYIVELQQDVCWYRCRLCGVCCDEKSVISHIIGIQHLKKYVKTHHPNEFSNKYVFLPQNQYYIEWHKIALRIHSAHGREKIQVEEDKGLTPAKVSKLSPNANELPDKTTDPLPDPSSQISSSSDKWIPPLALQQKLEMVQADMRESMKFLHFNSNADLLEFLRNFEIQNDEDAAILKELKLNCTAALMRFWEEQLNAELTQGSPAGSGPAPTDTDRACQESESCDPESLHSNDWSLSQCSIHKDDDASKSNESSDATEAFFSNIKDMEVSEVIANLERIAAENSAFNRINIPDLIKYLQDTGRLKKT